MSKSLEQIIAKLAESQRLHTAAWEEVRRAGRKYAQMKLHGSCIDSHGNNVLVHFSSRKDHEQHFEREVLSAIERAFLEDALLGASVQQTLSEVK